MCLMYTKQKKTIMWGTFQTKLHWGIRRIRMRKMLKNTHMWINYWLFLTYCLFQRMNVDWFISMPKTYQYFQGTSHNSPQFATIQLIQFPSTLSSKPYHNGGRALTHTTASKWNDTIHIDLHAINCGRPQRQRSQIKLCCVTTHVHVFICVQWTKNSNNNVRKVRAAFRWLLLLCSYAGIQSNMLSARVPTFDRF